MKGWNICDNDMVVAQYELESRQEYHSFLPGPVCNFSKPRTQSNLKPESKRGQKTSLKATRITQKPKENCDANSQTTKTSPTVHAAKGITPNSNIFAIRSQQKPVPKQICTKIKVQKINLQASQTYYFGPPSPGMPSKQQKPCTVKINYINTISQVPSSPITHGVLPPTVTVPKVETHHAMPVRTLKRTNTVPTRFVMENFEEEERKNPEVKGKDSFAELSKSMDYQQEVKLRSLKSTQNLNQLKCIQAESIADESQIQDQISIVISPFSDDMHQINKSILTDLWSGRQFLDANIQEMPASEQERLYSL